MPWPKREVVWFEDRTAYLSVPFTWLLPKAYSHAVFLHNLGYHVRAGGPAVSLMPHYLQGVAQIGGEVNALPHHNPNATFTTRGCIRRCPFCAVPTTEGDFIELPTWEPKPIVCDNNLLAASKRHFDRVVDSLKPLRGVDFNQGLDARLLRPYHVERITELDFQVLRLAWDHVAEETAVMRAIALLRQHGVAKDRIRVYVLVGFMTDTFAEAAYRCLTLKTMGIRPNVQRYQPLDTLSKDSYLARGWTSHELRRFCRYWNRQRWLEHIPYEEFDRR